MTKKKVVPLRVPESLDDLAALIAQIRYTDKATAYRQWLHEGAALHALQLVSEGRISIGKAAELLDLSIYDLHAIMEKYGLKVGPTADQRRRSHEMVDKLLAGKKERTSAG